MGKTGLVPKPRCITGMDIWHLNKRCKILIDRKNPLIIKKTIFEPMKGTMLRISWFFILGVLTISHTLAQKNGLLPLTGIKYFRDGVWGKSIEITGGEQDPA
jgi:hypothetical protein